MLDDIVPRLKDQVWRLNNLYWIKDENGNKVRFRMRPPQRHLFDNIHNFNVILKARQLGLSSFIMIYMLDQAIFKRNIKCAVIAQGLKEAKDLFDDKIRYAYDNLPSLIREMVPAVNDSAQQLTFGNGSKINVGTSMRGGTYQILHVSELGKISAKYPEKAREIKTGAFNTVHTSQTIFVESTAEGQSGEFFELCRIAQELKDMGKSLGPLDPKFFFYPWFEDQKYSLDELPIVTQKMATYFNKVEKKTGITLTDGQKAFYIKKANLLGNDMFREYPSMPSDAFSAPLEGAFYGEEMAWLRQNGRITSIPYDPKYLVHTFWDLGISNKAKAADMTAIVFFQQVGKEHRIIDYYEQGNKGIQHYAEYMRSLGYRYGNHYLPHDGTHLSLDTGQEFFVTAKQHGIKPIIIVPRTQSLANDIQATRNRLPMLWIDEVKCSILIRHLTNYRREWNDRLSVWGDAPRHDEASHGADAVRCYAIGYKETLTDSSKKDDNNDHNSSWVDW